MDKESRVCGLCREDVATAAQLGGSEEEQGLLYRDIASAAESGWDFSSRWLADGHTLASIQTTRVIPADLNAFLFKMETDLAHFAEVKSLHSSSSVLKTCSAYLLICQKIGLNSQDPSGGCNAKWALFTPCFEQRWTSSICC